jgi:hypothetical protein
MCCFFTTLILLGPRVAAIVWWLIRPLVWNATFSTIIWPILGIIFVPWTTLMYVLVYGANGIVGFDWLWLALALIVDIASYGGGAFGNRDRIGM